MVSLLSLLEEIEEEYELKSGCLVGSHVSIEEQLLVSFPLLSLKRHTGKKKYTHPLLVDAWEFVLPSSELLIDLFSAAKDCSPLASTSTSQENRQPVVQSPAAKPGRKAYHTIFPSMAQRALEFLQQHGWSAQERRRASIGNSVGVSLESLRKHLLETVPGLKEKGISRTSVHQLLLPPRQKTLNANRYHGVVPAKVPGKRNAAAQDHAHVQHCASQVNLAMEFAADHQDEVMAFSCDDMNKIQIGSMAVSRYHQIRRFFVVGDEPNYPDHDFPVKNNKIIPSGYLCLTSKSRGRSTQRRGSGYVLQVPREVKMIHAKGLERNQFEAEVYRGKVEGIVSALGHLSD